MSSSKRPRLSEVTSLENGTDEPKTKKRRLNETSAPASKTPNTTPAVPVNGNDPILVPPLAQPQASGDAPIVEQPRSGTELVATARTTDARETLEERGTPPGIADVSAVPELVHGPSPLLPVRSPSIQLVASSKPPKRKWRAKAFNSLQTAADDDYFETGPSSPNSHGAVVDPETNMASQKIARHEGAEDVESLDLEFEEVDLGETVAETFEQDVNTTSHLDAFTARNEPQVPSSPAEETSTTAAIGILPNTSDNEYRHTMPQYSEVPDVFSNHPVEDGTRTAIVPWLATHPKGKKGSQIVKKGLTSGQPDQGDSPATRNTLFVEETSGTHYSVDGHFRSPLPSSSAPHSPISFISTDAPAGANTPPHFKVAKKNGEGTFLKSSPIVSGPLNRVRAPPRGTPLPIRDFSPIRQSSPSQLRKEPRAERRRTFGGWPTTLASSSIRKGEAKIGNPRGKRRDSIPALPVTMVYRDQQEDADWLRTVEKNIKVIPRYSDPRKRSIPVLPPETSSDDTNTVNGSGDEDDLEERVSRMSSLDIEKVMNFLNIEPRNKVLKQWKRQNRSDAWIIWNGLVFVLEELADRFNTGVTAAKEVWAAAGDLVVTEKALYRAQETARNTVADVIKSEAEEASRRRMKFWAPSRQTPERWGGTSKRNSRPYQRVDGPPPFVPAEAVRVAVEAATSPWYDHDLKRGSSKVLHETFEELPMLSFDGVGPGGVTILRE
jgi:hypothetical protein